MQNMVIFEGNMVADPVFRQFDNNCVANFKLASSKRHYQKDGTYKEYTTFMDIIAWGRLAESVRDNYRKGNRVLVTDGSLKNDSWDDKKTGQKRYRTSIVAGWCVNLSRPFARSEREDAGDSQGPQGQREQEQEDRIDDLPV